MRPDQRLTRVAARTLASGHLYVTSYTEGFSHFVTSMIRSAASGLSAKLPGGACTHWKAPPWHGAHVERTSQRTVLDASIRRIAVWRHEVGPEAVRASLGFCVARMVSYLADWKGRGRKNRATLRGPSESRQRLRDKCSGRQQPGTTCSKLLCGVSLKAGCHSFKYRPRLQPVELARHRQRSQRRIHKNDSSSKRGYHSRPSPRVDEPDGILSE